MMILVGTLLLNIYSYVTNKINELFFKELFNLDESELVVDNKRTILNCKPLRVISYNIHNFYNPFWINTEDKIINYLINCDADVVCLQECRSPIYDKIKMSYASYIQFGEQVILSKHNITHHDVYLHPLIKNRNSVKTPMVRLELYIDNEKVEVLIANIHFSNDITLYEQSKNLKELLTFISNSYAELPIILIGDTNLNKITNLPYNIFTYNTKPTFPIGLPFLTLDRLFYRDLNLHQCSVDNKTKYSYHYPIVCEFLLK